MLKKYRQRTIACVFAAGVAIVIHLDLWHSKANSEAEAIVDRVLNGREQVDVFVPLTRALETKSVNNEMDIHGIRSMIKCKWCQIMPPGSTFTAGGTSIRLERRQADMPFIQILEDGVIILGRGDHTIDGGYICTLRDRHSLLKIAGKVSLTWPPQLANGRLNDKIKGKQ